MMFDFIEHTTKFNTRPFLVDPSTDSSYSYSQFRQVTQAFSKQLGADGLVEGERVAIILPNCVEFVGFYFACLYLGLVAVPINAQLHEREVNFILRNVGAKLIICVDETAKLIPLDVSAKVIVISLITEGSPWTFKWALAQELVEPPKLKFNVTNILSINFTSGTTGVPKGVVHTAHSLFTAAEAFNLALSFDENSRFYHVFSMSYMAGFLNTLICPYVAGGSVVIGSVFDALSSLTFWSPAIKYEVNTLWLVPTMLSALLRIDRGTEGSVFCRNFIRTACVGTAPLPVPLKRSFESRYGIVLLESYGLSETLFVSTNSAFATRLEGSVGQTLPGVELKFANDDDLKLVEGEGEIYIKTPFQMVGYLNYDSGQPEMIPAGSWFASGDVGKICNEALMVTGRKKDLIIRGGINVSPRAVEDVLMEHDCVDQVAIVGLPHDFYGEEVVAAIRMTGNSTLAELAPALTQFCKQRLNRQSVPTRFIEVSEFPVSSTGKIQKATLRAQLIEARSVTKQ